MNSDEELLQLLTKYLDIAIRNIKMQYGPIEDYWCTQSLTIYTGKYTTYIHFKHKSTYSQLSLIGFEDLLMVEDVLDYLLEDMNYNFWNQCVGAFDQYI